MKITTILVRFCTSLKPELSAEVKSDDYYTGAILH